MKFLVSLLVVTLAAPVLAQQPTPETQALGQKLMAEINANIQCSTAGITIGQQLAAAQARIKVLEDKYEPKKSEEKP